MPVTKLQNTDGFVVVDLEGADRAVGVVRLAPKVLLDGAELLARSLTYQYATFERRVSGASAAINAKADARAAAVEAFVGEVATLAAGGLRLGAGKGVGADELSGLAATDDRGPLVPAHAGQLTAAGVAEACASAVGGDLTARRVVLEGVDVAGLDAAALVTELGERGASVLAVSAAEGTVRAPAGSRLGAAPLAAALGGAGLAALGMEIEPAGAVFGIEADVLVCGSKAGVVDHSVAAGLAVRAVVPGGPVPVTAKALAVLRRAGVVVLPDFVTTAGPVFGSWRDDAADLPTVAAEARAAVAAVLAELAGHPDGPVLGACARAESFLGTWRDALPFGRPLA